MDRSNVCVSGAVISTLGQLNLRNMKSFSGRIRSIDFMVPFPTLMKVDCSFGDGAA